MHEKLNRVRDCCQFVVLLCSWCVSKDEGIQLNFLFVPPSNNLSMMMTNELSCVLGPVVVHNWTERSENSRLYPSMFNRTTDHLASVRHRRGQRCSQQKGELIPSCPPERLTDKQTDRLNNALSLPCPRSRRESASSRRSNSTDRKTTLHTDDQGSCDGSLPSRSCSDDVLPLKQPLSDQPGANLLSQSELKLCTSLNLPATKYITLKTVLLSGADHSYAIKQEPPPVVKSVMMGHNNGTGMNGGSHIESIRKFLTKAGWFTGGH